MASGVRLDARMILVRELPRSTLFGLGRVIGGAAVVIMLLLAGFHLAERMGWIGSEDLYPCESARVYCEQPESDPT